MTNATPALLALLLVLSLPATTLVAADVGDGMHSEPATSLQETDHATPTDIENTTNRLELLDPVQNEYTESSVDFGATLAGGDDELRIDHERYVGIDRDFAEADDEERAEILDEAHAALGERIETLYEREQTAVREHANGERTGDELRRTLLRNYHEATALLSVLDYLELRANEVPNYSLSSAQVREDTRSLEIHRSPIQSQLAGTSQNIGTTDRFQFLIQTSADGYRLSTIDGSNYVSETTRFDNYDPTAPDQFSERSAPEYAGSLYPWAESEGSLAYTEAGRIHDVEFSDNHFSVRMFIDGGSGAVHREIQELSTTSLPIVHEETHEVDGLELERRETPANGPVELTVTDGSSAVESVTIEIGEHVVGETDEDGRLWYVPPDSSYELTVTPAGEDEGSTVDVSNL
ncbi:hypothetical protein D8Y22_08640 [Salinadaptatus halalkaliphilus]|uniref:Uncharacterized protein n=1 Tax=Salinadaptatus halalkaliphilus TaxID=2419781 RepID=A0A4S3TM19_9EURY|nr:hypothetical protein [Salinadaptatus halalkaliphilus]THE65261.1 hypothetical protein D8Y22_08640 [Salinadaptatus halalkaliphilus]